MKTVKNDDGHEGKLFDKLVKSPNHAQCKVWFSKKNKTLKNRNKHSLDIMTLLRLDQSDFANITLLPCLFLALQLKLKEIYWSRAFRAPNRTAENNCSNRFSMNFYHHFITQQCRPVSVLPEGFLVNHFLILQVEHDLTQICFQDLTRSFLREQ